MSIVTHTHHTRQFDWAGQRDWGFGFDCDASGAVDEAALNPTALANYHACLTGVVDATPVVDRGVKTWQSRERICDCGSGKHAYELHDARGIFCNYVCEKCEPRVRAKYRPDIFEDATYWHDEPIDEDA